MDFVLTGRIRSAFAAVLKDGGRPEPPIDMRTLKNWVEGL